jgi:hypothetical protein
MERRDLETAAAKYSYLRGLLFIPLGALSVLSALGNWRVGPLNHDWVFVVGLLLIGAAYLLIARHYREHYGRLTPSRGQEIRAAIALAIGVAVMFGGAQLLYALDLPVNPIAVSFAVVMLVSYAFGVGLHAHHVVIWGGLLVIGALPVWTGDDSGNVGLVMCGAAVMLCGLFDHRLFVSTFGSPQLPALNEGNARA